MAQATQYGDGTDSRQDGVSRPGRLTPIDDYAGGPGRGAASLLWRNRDDDFPDWAGRDLTSRDPTARLVLLASDGATSATVAGEQLGRLRRLGSIPTLATVTMGGTTCWPPTAMPPPADR